MFKKRLVRELVTDGPKLLKELDRQNFPVQAMLWVLPPEREYWKLVIASPSVAKQDGSEMWYALRKIIQSVDLAGIDSSDVSLLDGDSERFRFLYSTAVNSGRLAKGEAWTEYNDGVVYRADGQNSSN